MSKVQTFKELGRELEELDVRIAQIEDIKTWTETGLGMLKIQRAAVSKAYNDAFTAAAEESVGEIEKLW